MNMISLVEVASADKSLCIHVEDQKNADILALYFVIYQISYINSML